jgi:hypothetical protein
MMKPENVRVVHPDGTETPCELIHDGPDENGIDQWTATGPVFRVGLDKFRVDVLPARTGISFAVEKMQ